MIDLSHVYRLEVGLMEYIITLNDIKAKVNSLGAELVSLTDVKGIEYIWQGHPSGWTGRNPNLFPVIGAVKPGGILYDGTAYPTPRHGFARHSEFSLVEKSESSITLELCESPETLSLYPYPFRLRISHRLVDNGFRTEYEVLNTGGRDMYYCVGGHTAFNCPLDSGEEFSQWKLIFEKEEHKAALLPLEGGFISFDYGMNAIVDGRFIPLDHELHDRIDTLIFDGLNSGSVSLTGPKGNGVKMDFSDFPMIAFWTAPGKHAPYICLEPWQGCGALHDEDGEFAHKPHALRLAPGESRTLGYTVTIL